MTALLERTYPALIGLAASGTYLCLRWTAPIPATAKDLFASIVDALAIAIGFLGTAKSILLSLQNKRVVRHLKEGGQYDDLLGYVMAAIHWSFCGAALTAVGLFVFDPAAEPVRWHTFAFAVWVFVVSTAAAACYRVVRLLAMILRSKDERPVRESAHLF